MSDIIFILGIDTDAGKSYATGWLARQLMEQGKTVATQKFIQTGNDGFSEDIVLHRRLMGIDSLPEDRDLTTSPVIFTYPASAQLAARIDGRDINLADIEDATRKLSSNYDVVLIEGAGGLMVPVTDDYYTIDYVVDHKLPMMLVTNGRLGSINHTVLSLEAIKARGIELRAVLYNLHFDSDRTIADDTHDFIRRYLAKRFPDTRLLDVPSL